MAGSNETHGTSGSHTGLFLRVFAALCVLTLVSFAIANSPLMKQPAVAWTTMMAVSCAKAILVIAFFMHLRWERAWKYALTIPSLLMAVFLVVSLVPDIGLRARAYDENRWRYATEGVANIKVAPTPAAVPAAETAPAPEGSETPGANTSACEGT